VYLQLVFNENTKLVMKGKKKGKKKETVQDQVPSYDLLAHDSHVSLKTLQKNCIYQATNSLQGAEGILTFFQPHQHFGPSLLGVAYQLKHTMIEADSESKITPVPTTFKKKFSEFFNRMKAFSESVQIIGLLASLQIIGPFVLKFCQDEDIILLDSEGIKRFATPLLYSSLSIADINNSSPYYTEMKMETNE